MSTSRTDNLKRHGTLIRAGLPGGLLIGGVAVFAWLVETKPVPAFRNELPRPLEVAVITVESTVEETPVIGHGTVRPKSQISIVPQVSGTLTYVHPDLAQGRIVPNGTLLFQIDKTIYEARVHQVEAEIKGFEASLAGHDQEAVNLDAQIATARQMLAIDESDFETSKRLYEVEKVGTQRDLDLVHQKYLRQKSAFVELESKGSMIPHLRLETEAQLDAARARLQQARHDLEATTIKCPFEARVESIGAHDSQFVTAHLSIATLTDMEACEISVGIDPRELRWLESSIRPEALNGDSNTRSPAVKVRWSLHGQEFLWTGHVTRFEKVDEATRTARMVVEIQQADMTARTGGSGDAGTSLSIGMFCRADLPAKPLQGALIVPRHAVYDNQWVFVFVPDVEETDGLSGRLERRHVPMLRSIRDEVLVDYVGRGAGQPCELAPGDRVVVSPLTKPVEGMRIRLRDSDVAQRILPKDTPPAEELDQRLAMTRIVAIAPGTQGGGGR